jgi:hypothetical protein
MLLLSGIAALLLASTAAYAADEELPPEAPPVPSIRVTPPPVPPLGWVYNYYAPCADPLCRTVVVNVDAAGLNVRTGKGWTWVLAWGPGENTEIDPTLPFSYPISAFMFVKSKFLKPTECPTPPYPWEYNNGVKKFIPGKVPALPTF